MGKTTQIQIKKDKKKDKKDKERFMHSPKP